MDNSPVVFFQQAAFNAATNPCGLQQVDVTGGNYVSTHNSSNDDVICSNTPIHFAVLGNARSADLRTSASNINTNKTIDVNAFFKSQAIALDTGVFTD